jgi:hypothetical protein
MTSRWRRVLSRPATGSPVPGCRTVTVRSSVQTVSEELDLGQEEFVHWQLGAVT